MTEVISLYFQNQELYLFYQVNGLSYDVQSLNVTPTQLINMNLVLTKFLKCTLNLYLLNYLLDGSYM